MLFKSKYSTPLKWPDTAQSILHTDLLHPADRLEVDVVVFAGCEGSVPVAVVSLVVSYSKRQRLLQISGRNLCCEVIWQAGADSALIGHRLPVTLASTGLPAPAMRIDLLHHYLIGAVEDEHNSRGLPAAEHTQLSHLSSVIMTD